MKMLACLIVRDEIDIIEMTVKKWLAGGVTVHIMDDWSTDGTWEALHEISGDIILERWPDAPGQVWDFIGQLRRIEEISLAHPDWWIIPTGSDDLLCSPWPGVRLTDAIGRVRAEGHNFIDTRVFNFVPTADGFDRGTDPEVFFTHGVADYGHPVSRIFIQPQDVRIDIATTAAHRVTIPDIKVYPTPFIYKHWPFRSQVQGERKIKERFARYSPEERAIGWHTHYGHIKLDEPYNFISSGVGMVRFADLYPGI